MQVLWKAHGMERFEISSFMVFAFIHCLHFIYTTAQHLRITTGLSMLGFVLLYARLLRPKKMDRRGRTRCVHGVCVHPVPGIGDDWQTNFQTGSDLIMAQFNYYSHLTYD
jgi:hypothetical protein